MLHLLVKLQNAKMQMTWKNKVFGLEPYEEVRGWFELVDTFFCRK